MVDKEQSSASSSTYNPLAEENIEIDNETHKQNYNPKTDDEDSAPCRQDQKEENRHEADNTYEGMAYVAASALSFSIMSLFVKMLANRGIPSFEIAFFNAGGRTLICYVLVARDSCRFSLGEKGREYIVFLRALFGYGGLATCFYGISVLPLGDATVIIFTAPAWTSVLAVLVLGETLAWTDIAAVLVSLCGVSFIARPTFLFGPLPVVVGGAEENSTGQREIVAAAVTLVGAVSSASAYICVRSIGRAVKPLVLVTVFSTFGTLVSLPLAWVVGQALVMPEGFEDWSLIFIMTCVGLSGQLLLNTGLQRGSASKVTLMRNLDIVFAFSWQVLFLNESVSGWSCLGATMIMVCSALTFFKGVKDQSGGWAECCCWASGSSTTGDGSVGRGIDDVVCIGMEPAGSDGPGQSQLATAEEAAGLVLHAGETRSGAS